MVCRPVEIGNSGDLFENRQINFSRKDSKQLGVVKNQGMAPKQNLNFARRQKFHSWCSSHDGFSPWDPPEDKRICVENKLVDVKEYKSGSSCGSQKLLV